MRILLFTQPQVFPFSSASSASPPRIFSVYTRYSSSARRDYSSFFRYQICRVQNQNQIRNQNQIQYRGKKTKTLVKLDGLHQGVIIPLEPLPLEEEAAEAQAEAVPSYPTVVMQARSNMRRFENCVLLTRVGGFYELYFEHAEEFGPLMNLKVAQKRTNAGPVSMVRSLSSVQLRCLTPPPK